MIIGKGSIRPTTHYLLHHSDVAWDLVVTTVLSLTKTHPNRRKGKDRFTYLRKSKKSVVEVHTKNDGVHGVIWVINAFQARR